MSLETLVKLNASKPGVKKSTPGGRPREAPVSSEPLVKLNASTSGVKMATTGAARKSQAELSVIEQPMVYTIDLSLTDDDDDGDELCLASLHEATALHSAGRALTPAGSGSSQKRARPPLLHERGGAEPGGSAGNAGPPGPVPTANPPFGASGTVSRSPPSGGPSPIPPHPPRSSGTAGRSKAMQAVHSGSAGKQAAMGSTLLDDDDDDDEEIDFSFLNELEAGSKHVQSDSLAKVQLESTMDRWKHFNSATGSQEGGASKPAGLGPPRAPAHTSAASDDNDGDPHGSCSQPDAPEEPSPYDLGSQHEAPAGPFQYDLGSQPEGYAGPSLFDMGSQPAAPIGPSRFDLGSQPKVHAAPSLFDLGSQPSASHLLGTGLSCRPSTNSALPCVDSTDYGSATGEEDNAEAPQKKRARGAKRTAEEIEDDKRQKELQKAESANQRAEAKRAKDEAKLAEKADKAAEKATSMALRGADGETRTEVRFSCACVQHPWCNVAMGRLRDPVGAMKAPIPFAVR
eukprot:gene2392-8700_t